MTVDTWDPKTLVVIEPPTMDVNEVRVAEDKDFEVLKIYLSRNDGWSLEYEQSKTSVWTRQACESDFKMIRVSYLERNYLEKYANLKCF